MPKTLLFKTELSMEDDYVESQEDIDIKDLIKPGMVFRMDYTQTKNYISEEASTQVMVVSVGHIIDGCCDTGVYVQDCVLKTDAPIFICARRAELGRPFTLYSDTVKIAIGSVVDFLDELRDKWKYASV